jgi:glycosyltransferase involved in cell wall biosynthesis
LQPLVSVIIPSYNRGHLLGETLDSVLSQTYKNWECIVVDDGSCDYTEELLEFYCSKDSRIQFHRRPKCRRKGANACRNYGFELCKGDFINWFDSDDLMDRDKLKFQVKALINSNYNYSVCQTRIFKNSLDQPLGLKCEKIHSSNILYDYLIQQISWLTQAPLWRKSFLKCQKLLFDENLQAAQEWEFHCRVLASCSNYHTIEKPLVYLREHKESLTYNEDHELRVWNYFLARLKVYKNSKINLDRISSIYLQNYLLHNFKSFIRSRSLRSSFNSLLFYIYAEKNFKVKTKAYATLSMFSYLIFNKGHYLLNKVYYKR